MTEHELERMIVRILGDVEPYVKSLKEAESASKEAASKIEAHLSKVNTVALGLTAVGVGLTTAFGGIAHEAVSAFSEAEGIGLRLTATLEANGREVEALTEQYKRFADQLRDTMGLEDDFVLSLAASAEAFGLSGKAAEEAITNAASLAALKGGAAESYLRFTAAMVKGDTELAMHMARMIPELRGIKDETEFVARAQQLYAAGSKAAAAQAATFSGRMKILSDDWGNMLEDIGKVIAEALTPLVEWLTETLSWFRQLSPEMQTVIAVVIGLGAATGVLLTTAGAAILVYQNLIATTLTYVTAANAATVATIAFKAALIAGPVVAVAWIVANTEAAKAFNAEMAKMAAQSEFTRKQLGGRAEEVKKRVEAAPGDQRQDLVAQEMLKAEAIVKLHEEKAKEAKKAYDDARTHEGGDPFGNMARDVNKLFGIGDAKVTEDALKNANAELAAAKGNAAAVRQQFDAFGKAGMTKKVTEDVEALTKSLREQAETFGMTEGAKAIYLLQTRGATESALEEAHAWEEVNAWLAAVAQSYEAAAEAQKKLSDEAAALANDLESQIATFGMSADMARIYRMELEGLDQATADHLRGLAEQKAALEKQQKMMEDGQRITEQVLGKDPSKKYAMEVQKLRELLGAGAITQEVYNMGVKQAAEEMRKAGAEADKMGQKFDASLSGSADALQKIQRQRDMASGRFSAEVKGGQKWEVVQRQAPEAAQRQQKQERLMEQGNGFLRRIAERPVFVVEAANLA